MFSSRRWSCLLGAGLLMWGSAEVVDRTSTARTVLGSVFIIASGWYFWRGTRRSTR